ncbi:MAG: N-acetylmuramoyl-L-alanine amidase [Gemmatimonadota bacterium]
MHSHVIQKPLAAPRGGIMLHYDDSSSDHGALEWFHDPRCRNGYTWLVLDDGRVVELADPGMRTPHAGPCLTPMANSRFYGIAATTNGSVCVTAQQQSSIVRLCFAIARFHKWSDPVLVGHDEQAVWTAEYTKRRALWGTVGRKVDPTGRRPDGVPVLDVRTVKDQVLLSLSAR